MQTKPESKNLTLEQELRLLVVIHFAMIGAAVLYCLIVFPPGAQFLQGIRGQSTMDEVFSGLLNYIFLALGAVNAIAGYVVCMKALGIEKRIEPHRLALPKSEREASQVNPKQQLGQIRVKCIIGAALIEACSLYGLTGYIIGLDATLMRVLAVAGPVLLLSLTPKLLLARDEFRGILAEGDQV